MDRLYFSPAFKCCAGNSSVVPSEDMKRRVYSLFGLALGAMTKHAAVRLRSGALIDKTITVSRTASASGVI